MGRVKILKASAGSGKTYKLAYEYVKNIIIEPAIFRHILAVTFTNKATTEMKGRILDEIENLCDGAGFMDSFAQELKSETFGNNLSNADIRAKIISNAKKAQKLILHDYSNFSVMTIDRFFQKIFRAFCKELGVDTTFQIGLNDSYFLGLAIDSLIENYQSNKQLEQWVLSLMDDRIEEGKKYDFKDDILKISKKIFSREFNREHYLQNVDSIEEFFNIIAKYDSEIKSKFASSATILKDKIDELGLTSADFIQASRGLYPYVCTMAKSEFKPYNSYITKMLDISNKWNSKGGRADEFKTELHPLLVNLCSQWDEFSKDYYTIDLILSHHREFLLLLYVAKELDAVCRTNNTLLLSSSVKIITSLINNNDTPYIYEKIGNRYDILMIDEFQDTSFDQWNNFVPIALNSISLYDDSVTTVTLVGDVKQSIYMWRGGDWRIFEYEVINRIDRDVITIETLDTNWRSERNIITFNNLIIRSALEVLNDINNKDIDSAFGNGNISEQFRNKYFDICQVIYSNMEQEVAPKNRDTEGYIEVINYKEEENLQSCVKIIEDSQLRDFQPKDIVILVRSKKDIPIITKYISQYKKNNSKALVSYEIMSKDGLLLKNSHLVRFIIACYQVAVDAGDSVSINIINKFISQNYGNDLTTEDAEFIALLNRVSICESFEMICSHFLAENVDEDIAYLQAIHNKIIDFSRGAYPDIIHFLEYWNSESDGWGIELPSEQNAIRIETIHAVKGLEFEVVIVPYCSWSFKGTSSMMWAKSSNETYAPYGAVLLKKKEQMMNSYFSESYYENNIMESIESFNIFYVALTRASKELYIMTEMERPKALVKALQNCFSVQEDRVTIIPDNSELIGKVENGNYVFGTKSSPSEKEVEGTDFIINYPSFDYKMRIVLRNANDKYFAEPSDNQEMREIGILKHRVLEQINYTSDIDGVLLNMLQQGILTTEQHSQLSNSIYSSLKNPIIANFFDSKWEIRNENSILLFDDTYSVFRPDRVMSQGGSAIVVDYKFGKQNKSHMAQIENYKKLLMDIGYSDVKGYIWYIGQDTLIEVN